MSCNIQKWIDRLQIGALICFAARVYTNMSCVYKSMKTWEAIINVH